MTDIKLTDREDVRELIRQKYGDAAKIVLEGRGEACCGTGNIGTGKHPDSCCSATGGDSAKDVITASLYSDAEASEIPDDALLASLGCGNPTALASLAPGEIVLDLGSGGGIDVLLSARRVGPTGFAYGLDMTDEMLALAEKNRAAAGATNVEFLKGHIEAIPLADNSVDVIISNCVINLSADKDAVLREAFRVLKPGGRFAVSDVVVEGELPDAVRRDMEAYVGCVAGALEKSDYLERLASAGFTEATIQPTRRYMFADLDGSMCRSRNIASLPAEEKAALDGRIMGAFIRAIKPGLSNARDCCDTDCCAGAEPSALPCCGDECCTDLEAAAATQTVQVFDPALCCATGVCGADFDPALVGIAADLAWLKRNGVSVERFNLGLQPQEFVSRRAICSEIQRDPNVLPIVVVNSEIVSRGKYPARAEFAQWLGLPGPAAPIRLQVVS